MVARMTQRSILRIIWHVNPMKRRQCENIVFIEYDLVRSQNGLPATIDEAILKISAKEKQGL